VGDELTQLRERLAAQVIAANRMIDEPIAAALRDVPRHLFLPELRPEVAYIDDAIVTKRDESGRAISSSSQPAMMAIMLVQLDLAPGQRVLEIGAGTGYNAALMRHIIGGSGQVTSVDIDGPRREGPRPPVCRRVPRRHRALRGRRRGMPRIRALRPDHRDRRRQ